MTADARPSSRRRRRADGRRRRSALAIGLAVAAALALMATACGGGTTDDGPGATGSGGTDAPTTTEDPSLEPQAGGSLTYAVIAETDGWNPAASRWAASGLSVSRAIFDTLGAFDDNGKVQPYLAKSFQHNAEFTVWTIGLRPDVTFHDGTPVDAAAVKANLDAFKTSALTSGALANVKTIEVTDPATVTVTLSAPWSTYPTQLAGQVGTIAAPATLASPEGARNPIGSGPFVFESWNPGSDLSVTKNPAYWRDGFPLLDRIDFKVIVEDKSRADALRSGDIDAMENFDPGTEDSFRAPEDADPFRILADPRNETDEAMVMLNLSRAPFDDPVARRAMVHATDRVGLVELLSPNLEVADSPYPEASKWHTDVDYPDFDMEAAKREVEEYKAAHGGAFEFQLEGVPQTEVQRVEQFLQQSWSEAGMTVTINNVEQATLINTAISGKYQATMWRQFGSPSPDGEYVWWHGSNVNPDGEVSLNFARNKDADIDEALTAARATDDEATQKAAWDTVQQRHAEILPYVWLYHSTAGIIASVKVHDLTDSVLPDGQKALGQNGVTHDWNQVWVS